MKEQVKNGLNRTAAGRGLWETGTGKHAGDV